MMMELHYFYFIFNQFQNDALDKIHPKTFFRAIEQQVDEKFYITKKPNCVFISQNLLNFLHFTI